MEFPGTVVMLPVASTALLIAVGPGGIVSWLLSRDWLVWVGDRSYGLYLWHWPLIVFAERLSGRWIAVVGAVALSLVAADRSYRWLEKPLRPLRSESMWRIARLAAACAVVPAVLASGLIVAADRSFGIDEFEQLAERTEARGRGCHTDLDEPILPIEQCSWTVDDPIGTIFLVGDSHAVSMADTVVREGNSSGYDVVVRTRSLCPFQSRRLKRRGCAAYQRDTLLEIDQMDAEVVVIVNRATIYVNSPIRPPSSYAIVDAADAVTTTPGEAVQAWRDGMAGVLGSMPSSVKRIIIVESGPEFDEGGGAESVSLLTPSGRSRDVDLAEVDELRQPTMEVHAELAAGDARVVIIDPIPLVCSKVCSQKPDADWLYYDDDHMSPAGADRLSEALRSAWTVPR